MTTPIHAKRFRAWIDQTPEADPTWVECPVLDPAPRGELSMERIPHLTMTVTVQLPEGLPAAVYDPRKPTRARIEADTPAPVSLPWCYIMGATINRRTRTATLTLASRDGLLLDPGNPSPDVWSWREFETLGDLVQAVCLEHGLSVTVPPSTPWVAPVYEKTNLLTNPRGAAGTVAPGAAPDAVIGWYGTGYNAAVYPPKFTASGGQLRFMPHAGVSTGRGRCPKLTPGETYTATVMVRVPAGSPLIGKQVYFELRQYAGELPGYYTEIYHYDVFTLVEGEQRLTITKTLDPYLNGDVEIICAAMTEVTGHLEAYDAALYPYDPGDPIEGEYWDGSTPNTSRYEYVWEGNSNNSVSRRVPVEGTIALESALQEPGESLWSVLEPHMARHGYRLLPVLGQPDKWRLVKTADIPISFATPLDATSTAGEYIEAETTLDRQAADYADLVIVRYRWQTARGVQLTETDTAETPGWSPQRPMLVELEQPYPGAGAAQARLDVARLRGHVEEAVYPLDLYWRPGDTLETDTAYSLITAISFDGETDTMTVTGTPVIA